MQGSHPRSGSRGQGVSGPRSQTEQELHEVCVAIGQKAAQKFVTLREAFRFLAPDRKGKISKSDARYFFRAYDVDSDTADRFFRHWGAEDSDKVDWVLFVSMLRPHIQPGTQSPRCRPGSSPMPNSEQAAGCQNILVLDEASPDALPAALEDALSMVKQKALERFSHVREVLRIVDVDYDGFITCEEVTNFFRAFGAQGNVASILFNHLAAKREGGAAVPRGICYNAFVNAVGPSLMDLQGAEVALQSALANGEGPQRQLDRPYGTSESSSARNSRPERLLPCAVQESRRSSQQMGLRQVSRPCTPDMAAPAPSRAQELAMAAAAAGNNDVAVGATPQSVVGCLSPAIVQESRRTAEHLGLRRSPGPTRPSSGSRPLGVARVPWAGMAPAPPPVGEKPCSSARRPPGASCVGPVLRLSEGAAPAPCAQVVAKECATSEAKVQPQMGSPACQRPSPATALMVGGRPVARPTLTPRPVPN